MKKLRLWALLALTTAFFAAATVSPAAAGGHGSGHAGLACLEDFSSLAALTGTTTGTARTVNGETLIREKDTDEYSGSTEITQKTPGKPTAGTIPVYFHVVYRSDGRGRVTEAQVQQQIAVLNMSFAGFYQGYGVDAPDTGFRFELKKITYTQNNAWYAQATFADEYAMKSQLKEGGAADLNIYSTSGGGYLGWAYYPSIVTSNQYRVLDGVVIHYGSMPGGHITNYNLGYTATHEVGHYLGLPHTFEQGCQGHGDYSDDTPYQAWPTSGCPIGQDTCTKREGSDPIHNFMDYSYDSCYIEFTSDQSARMQKQYAHWRLKRA